MIVSVFVCYYSFFKASAGLVRAARMVCQRTEAREIAKAEREAVTNIHAGRSIRYTNVSRYRPADQTETGTAMTVAIRQ